MKKISLLLVLTLVLFSCKKDDPTTNVIYRDYKKVSHTITKNGITTIPAEDDKLVEMKMEIKDLGKPSVQIYCYFYDKDSKEDSFRMMLNGCGGRDANGVNACVLPVGNGGNNYDYSEINLKESNVNQTYVAIRKYIKK